MKIRNARRDTGDREWLFDDAALRWRSAATLGMVCLMVAAAGWSGEREIIFPEAAALALGLWIVDKRVWRVGKLEMVALMTIGAVGGVCIVRFSPLPFAANLCAAFAFAAFCLWCSRTTLVPLISACMLPVLLGTESWVYPLAVCAISVILAAGRRAMEKYGFRSEIRCEPLQGSRKRAAMEWAKMGVAVFLVSSFAVATSNIGLVIPPLVVTFVEFVESRAGFRSRPLQTVFLLTVAAFIGVFFRTVGCDYLHIPAALAAGCALICLFAVFGRIGKFFAPAGALVLIPMLLPKQGLWLLPVQVAAGSALFIFIAMFFFQQCYKWPRARLLFCLTPVFLRDRLPRKTRPVSE